MAVNAAVTLLHSIGVPRDLEVNQLGAMVLKVDAFRSGVCGQQDAHRRVSRPGLECSFDALALIAGHATVDEFQTAFLSKAVTGQ